MKKPTKKERAEAVLFLQQCASMGPLVTGVVDWPDDPVETIALVAWDAVMPDIDGDRSAEWYRPVYAEAAQLLEEGWCPGDDMVGR